MENPGDASFIPGGTRHVRRTQCRTGARRAAVRLRIEVCRVGTRTVRSRTSRWPCPSVPRVAHAHARSPASSSAGVVAGRPLPRRASGRGLRAGALRPLFRQEQHPLRQVRVEDLHDRPLRDLLLPADRAASRARGRLRRERLPAGLGRPETRPLVQGAADPVQDAQRVRAAERRAARRVERGRGRLRGADARPDAAADRLAVRSALRPHHPRAHAHLRVRHHPAVAHPPQRAAVGERGAVRLRARPLGADRPHDGARRRRRRHRPEDERAAGLRQLGQPAPDLQPGARGVRVHRGEVRQGRHPAVPLRAAQERDRRRRRRVRGSAADEEGRVRRGLRALPEGSLQAVPRQGAAGRLRAGSGAEPGEDAVRRGARDRSLALGRPD